MRKLMKTMLGYALFGALSAQPVLAVQDEDIQFDTTEDLFQVCSVPAGAPESISASFACRAFIEATVQYHDAVTDRQNLKRLICYPKGATIADGQEAFLAWAKKHQQDAEMMNEMPVVGLVRALAGRYPCR